MRLLIVSQVYRPENFRVNELAEGLARRGHQVTVLTGLPNYPGGRFFDGYGWRGPWRETLDGVEVVRAPLIPRGRGGALRLTLNYLSFALAACVRGPLACRGSYDAIIVHEVSPITVGLPAIVMKRLKRAPMLFWVLDLWPESLSASGMVSSSAVLAAAGALTRFIYRFCDKIVVSSRGFKGHIQAQGVPESKIDFFPQWAESVYAALPAPQREGPLRVMFAGNIGSSQDFPTILAAAEILKDRPEVEWLIVGGGRMLDWVRGQVAARGLEHRVRLLGHHPPQRMPEFFARADAMLVTLKRAPIFALTAPAKLQAYLASAKPILAALDGEGARVVAESGAGLAVASEDAPALARAALELSAKTAEELSVMGACGRAYGEREFDFARLMARLEGWLAQMTAAG